MKRFFSLLKYDLINSYSLNKLFKGGKAKGILIAVGAVLLILFILAYIAVFAVIMGMALSAFDALYIMVGGVFFIETAFSLLFSIRLASTSLFAFKDYDLLMAMPIKPRHVLFEKVGKLYIGNFISTLAICVPFLVVNGIFSGASVLYYLSAFLLLFFVPMIPIMIGAVLAFVIMRITVNFKRSNLMNIIFTLLLTVVIMVIPMSISFLSPQLENLDLATMGIDFSSFWDILGKYPPALLFTQALSQGNILSGILFLLLNIAVFALFIFAFARSFHRINTLLQEKSSRSNYTFREQKATTPFKALFLREMRSFGASHQYVLNTLAGPVMCLVVSVLLLFFARGSDFQELFEMIGDNTTVIVAVAGVLFSFCFCLSPTTAVTVSFEGKTFWLSKSLPVSVRTIFLSKIALNLLVNLPFMLISALIFTFYFHLGLVDFLLLLVMGLGLVWFSSVFGLFCNLGLPKMNWSTQQQVVKNSASILVSMIPGFLIPGLGVLLYIVFIGGGYLFQIELGLGTLIFLFGFDLFLILLGIGTWFLLMGPGRRMYSRIEG